MDSSGEGIVCDALAAEGYPVSLCGISALDSYLGLPPLPFALVETDADLSALARAFEGLRFPGVDLADAAVDTGDKSFYFRCFDRDETQADGQSLYSYKILSLVRDLKTRRFRDPLGIYPILRQIKKAGSPGAWWEDMSPKAGKYRAVMDGALILARYAGVEMSGADIAGIARQVLAHCEDFSTGSREQPPGQEAQKLLLVSLLLSARPDRGLDFLKRCGFLDELWPELAILDGVDHSKEFHPEGNVWKHTLETFRHRKPLAGGAYDLRLSLGLLLHDSGKPLSASSGSRRFDGHAELGAGTARRFLTRLGFESSLIEDVFYLVRNHMLPAALPRLPLARTGEIMASPLFPVLMELYRCDEASSFKGLDGYYASSAAYQAYLRYRRNPYRSADGKKLGVKNLRNQR
jgi:poly(A) polymerase